MTYLGYFRSGQPNMSLALQAQCTFYHTKMQGACYAQAVKIAKNCASM
jgi:hypothetical protein